MTQRKKTNGDRDINEIESDLDRTREAISDDLREIGDRLSPEHIKQEVKNEVKQAASEMKDAATEKLRDAKDAATEKFREVKDAAAEKLHTATDMAAEKIHTVTDATAEKLREAKEVASESVSHAVEAVSETFDHVRDGARRAGASTLGFARANAVPLALLGIGAAWLIANQRASRTRELHAGWQPPEPGAKEHRGRREHRIANAMSGTAHRVRDRAEHAVEGVKGNLSRAREKTGAIVARAEERGHEIVDRAEHAVSDGARRARSLAQRELGRARDLAEANPIALGAAALVAGIGIGLLLPATRRENALLGPSRDKLLDGAKETVHGIEQVAKDLGHTAKETAREMKNGLSGTLAGH